MTATRAPGKPPFKPLVRDKSRWDQAQISQRKLALHSSHDTVWHELVASPMKALRGVAVHEIENGKGAHVGSSPKGQRCRPIDADHGVGRPELTGNDPVGRHLDRVNGPAAKCLHAWDVHRDGACQLGSTSPIAHQPARDRRQFAAT
jgi:hypothetical protein